MQMKPREFWIVKDEFSNRGLFRDVGEKWPDDIDGKPSKDWKHFIEYSAYERLLTENERLADKIHEERRIFNEQSAALLNIEKEKVTKLRSALEFYADKDFWTPEEQHLGDKARSVLADVGAEDET